MATYLTLVLLNLNRWENPKKPGTGYSLDVVQSVQDGKNKGVGVEKVYFKDGGAKRILKPLAGADLNTVWKERDRIKGLMDNPPPIPAPAQPDTLGGAPEGTWGDRAGGVGGGSLGGGSIGGGKIDSEEF